MSKDNNKAAIKRAKYYQIREMAESNPDYLEAIIKVAKEIEHSTLHLVLKRKWWDMILSGEKKEEYRTLNDYWSKRLLNGPYYCGDKIDRYKPFEYVCFHLGYTNTTMTFRIVRLSQGYGVPEWGGGNERVFIISLGERICRS